MWEKLDRVKRIWFLSSMRAANVQASLRIRAVSPEPSLLAHTSSESRGTFRQKARSLAPLNGWACAVEICHDGMLEDTNSLDGAQIYILHYFTGMFSISYWTCSVFFLQNFINFVWLQDATATLLPMANKISQFLLITPADKNVASSHSKFVMPWAGLLWLRKRFVSVCEHLQNGNIVYTKYIFLTHYSTVKPQGSNFGKTAIVPAV